MPEDMENVVIGERGAVSGLRDRVRHIVESCRGKRVLHVGCCASPLTRLHLERGELLHQRLLAVSGECVGADLDGTSVALLKEWLPGSAYVVGDVCDVGAWPDIGIFDVIIAGEIIEHLDRPVDALRGLRGLLKDEGMLLATVPNAFSLKGALRALARRERVHRDHVAWYSPRTLRTLGTRAGLAMMRVHGYLSASERLLHRLFGFPLRLVVAFAPNLADGLIVEFRKAGVGREG